MTVLIVGHGESTNNFDDEFVDSYNTVIRFAHYPGRLGSRRGTKTDVLVEKVFDSSSIINSKIKAHDNWIVAGSFDNTKVQDIRDKLKDYTLTFGFEIEQYHMRYIRDLNAKYDKIVKLEPQEMKDWEYSKKCGLSRGTQAIIMACHRLRDNNIVLIGFDAIDGVHGPHHMDLEMDVRKRVAEKTKKNIFYCIKR